MTLDLSKKTDAELAEILDTALLVGLSMKAQEGFTVEAFHAFFEGGHGTPLHPAGIEWLDNIWEAHEERKGTAQEVFRGGGKTTVAKYLMSFYIGHHPEHCNLIVRINDPKANETSESIAYIIEHTEFWKLCFPHVVPDKAKGWGAEGYEVKREDMSYAKWARIKAGMPPDPTFVGRGWKSGSIIGSRVNGMLLVDDIQNEDNVSGVQLASVKKFVTDTLFPVMMDGVWEIWDFTPWTEDDVYAYILSTGQYKHNKTPVIIEDEDGEEWPLDPEIPLSGKKYRFAWPRDKHGFGWDFVKLSKTYKQQGHLGFARMYLLDLKAAEGQTLKAEWLEPTFPYLSLKSTWSDWLGVDFASSADQTIARNKELDYFVLAHGVTIPAENRFILVDGVREHMGLGEALVRVESYAAQLPYLQWIGSEAVGGGLEFTRELMRNTVLPIHSCKPSDTYAASQGKTKGARFENWMSAYFQFGRASLIDAERAFLGHFRNEWLTFPGKHDDCLDGVFWAMWVAALFGGLIMRYSNEHVGEQTNPMYKEKKKKKSPYSGLGDYRG